MNRYSRAGRSAQDIAQGRDGRADDAQSPRLFRDLARPDADRRHRRARQPRSARRRRSPTRCRSRGATRLIVGEALRRTSRAGAIDALAGRCAAFDARVIAAISGCRRPLTAERAARRHARRPRAAHLHLGHDGPAEGGRGQPSPHRRLEHWFAGLADLTRDRPPLRLPADAPQRRRRGRDRRAAGQRRLGRDRRTLLGEPLLGRRRALRMHRVPVYRRTLPLSRRRAARAPPRGAQAAARDRQRARAEVWRALPRPASGRCACSNSTPPPKAMSGSTMSRAASARLGRVPPYLAAREPIALASVRRATRRRPWRGAGRLLPPLRGTARSARRSGASATSRLAALRGLQRRARDRKEDPARRVRAGRRLDAHRRSDAPRRRGFL